jgi:phosphatidylinositol-3-phosphatase
VFTLYSPKFARMSNHFVESSRVRLALRAGAAAAIAATSLALAAGSATGSSSTAAVTHQTSTIAHGRVGHVFVIVLENEDYAASYVNNKNPWLGHKLQLQGTLLTKYYGTGHNSLDNYVSMISGQAPDPETSADCQQYRDFQPAPAPIGAGGQAMGNGCVYPTNVLTLADQLTKKGVSWRGYMEDMGNTPGRESKPCGQPGDPSGAGVSDDTQGATAQDQYAARHNPFVYFHSLLDSGLCKKHVFPLTTLTGNLKQASTTPKFTFITPNLCDDGHDTNCAGKDAKGSQAGGLVSIDHFLSIWIPRIKQSAAFKKNGVIVITTDEAASSDATSCCGEQPGPNDPQPGIRGPGGGRTGALVIGKCVAAGKKDSTPYNHYSLLRTLEDIFGITTGGSDSKGHLGFAGASGPKSFGKDVFPNC